jgi:MFS transporter, MHS family, shikimate and dehydroshikimate transport protein
MERVGGEEIGQRSSIRQVVGASFVGTALEWYDYFIYGTAAALVFPELFFPGFSPLAGTLASFATFAVGFFVRPLGAVFFGHYGDRVGRKAVLVTTLLVMGIATFLIGVLPTFETIGILGAVGLVVLRLFQGFAVGGEWGGAVLMAVEHSPADRRGFHGSWPQMGAPAGLVLSTAVFAAFAALPEQQFLSWGWRVPFLLSFVLLLVGLYIRLRITETPIFSHVKETHTEARAPIIDVVRSYPKNIALGTGARISIDVAYYIFAVYTLSYVTEQLGLPSNTVLVGLLIAGAIEILTIPFFGSLSDRVGQRQVFIGGAVFLALFALPYFWMLNTRTSVLIWLALVLGLSVGHAAAYGPMASFIARLFEGRVRYSGTSLSYQLAGILGGALAPSVATLLYAAINGPELIALYMVALCGLTVVCVYLASDFPGDEPEEGRLVAERQELADQR